MSVDRAAFRAALSQFATSVAIVTARGLANEAIGMTMSSFNSVSLEPPLVLFSVDRRAHSLPGMIRAKGNAVNVLSRHQKALSDQFAHARGDKWHAVQHWPGHADAPLLYGTIAHFECEAYARHPGGDHLIFIGRVLRFSSQVGADPLLFFRGKYHSVRPVAETPVQDGHQVTAESAEAG